jgi:hypothetical protein
MKMEPNKLKVQILGPYDVDFDKNYQLYFSLGGVNFVLIGKPIKRRCDIVWFAIKDSKIELRKYPRLKTESLNIKVVSEDIVAKLLDISLGGCKIKIEKSSIEKYTRSSANKILQLIFPDGQTYFLKAYVVHADSFKKTIAFAFQKRSETIIKVYALIVEMLKSKGYKGELPSKVE